MQKEQAAATAAHPKSSPPISIKNISNLEGRMAKVLPCITSPAGKRVLEFIVKHPNCWTHEIARECACANVSDAVMRMRPELDRAGIFLSCYLPERDERLLNHFGEVSFSHRWKAVIQGSF